MKNQENLSGLNNGDIARALLKKHPSISNLGAARRLVKDYPDRFLTFNAAHASVRRQRGEQGAYQRKTVKDPVSPSPYREEGKAQSPLRLPEPVVIPYDRFVLDGAEKVLSLSDIHWPFSSRESLILAIEEGERFNPDVVLINGDFFDFHRLSRFVKEPEARKVIHDLEGGYKIFEVLRETFKKARIIYKFGNHDEWFSVYIKIRAPELADLPSMELDEQFWYKGQKLSNLGVETVKDQRIIMAGRLAVLHGHEINMKSVSVNPARTAFLKCQESVLVGHLHKASQHSETNMYGKLISTWSQGCLCQLHPKFARINQWTHGFACIEIDRSGGFNVMLKRVYKGRVWA